MKLFSFVFILLFLHKKSLCQQEISVEPTNTSVLIGADATLKCTISNQQGEITWCKETFCTFGRNRNFSDTRLSLQGDSTKGEHNLVIKNVTINDNLAYQCQVSASEKSPAKKSNFAYLTVLVKPTSAKITSVLKTDNNTVKLVMKQNTIVECVSEDSNPPTDFNWYLDTQLLAVGGDIIEISKKFEKTANKLFKTTGKLVVKVDTDSKWNGKQLKCEAYNEASKRLNADVSDTKSLIVHYAPIINIIKLTNGDVVDDELVQFECSADGRPPVTSYKWYIDARTFSTGPGEKYLTLKAENSMHKKLLKCDATNEVSTQTASYTLDINYGPKFSKPLPSHKLVALEEKLVLLCDVDSNPTASIFWKLNGTTVYTYPNYTIHSMHKDDYGIYTCVASLKDFPTVSSSIKVLPPSPPIIEADLTQYAYVGYEASIEAITETEPKAENIVWLKDKLLLNTKENPKYKVDSVNLPTKGVKHVLYILGTIQDDFTNYTFIASNKYGESRQQIQLLPKANLMENYLIMISTISIIFLILFIVTGCILFRYCKTRDLRKRNIKKIKQKMRMKRNLNQDAKKNFMPFYTNTRSINQFTHNEPVVEIQREYPYSSLQASSEMLYPSSSPFRSNPSYAPDIYEIVNSRRQTPYSYIDSPSNTRVSQYQTDV